MIAGIGPYLVTDPVLCGARGVVETVRQAVEGGARIVQLHDKAATDDEVVAQLVTLSRFVDDRALLLVNDGLDAALAARAQARVDGVHLGQGDVSVLRARAPLGPDAFIDLTAHSDAHLDAVLVLPRGTVNYLGVGVIRATETKPDHPPVLGVEGFCAFAGASPLPCTAIGGIGGDDTPLRAAGAAGVAVVSQICAADDARVAAEELTRRWRSGEVFRVLSIAGSGPFGGAGIQADLKSIAANGGYGMAALMVLTAHNTQGVRTVHVQPADFLRAQLDAVSDDIVIDVVKIGMLANADVVRTVTDWLDASRPAIVVVDPVMVATSGDRLLDPEVEAELTVLLRRAHVATPNLAELAMLSGREVHRYDDAVAATEQLSFGTAAVVLVKGGHLGGDEAPDVLVAARHGVGHDFVGARIATRKTHGTGCSLSSALATRLVRGETAAVAVSAVRSWMRESDALRVGRGLGPVSHFAGL